MNLSKKVAELDNVIAIFGAPRSGTSWLGQILNSSPEVLYRYQPLFSYEFKSRLSDQSSLEDIDAFHRDLITAESDFVLQNTNITGHAGPRFRKEAEPNTLVWKEVRYHQIIKNLLEKKQEIKIIGIVRNPKSVINSWYHAPKEFNKEIWDIAKEWRDAPSKNIGRPEEFNGYNKWKETANLYLELQRQYPDRFYLVNYAQLLRDIEEEVKRIFDFCSIIYTDQTANFIKESQTTDFSKDAYSVYRSNQTDDKWKEGLPEYIIEEIDRDTEGTELAQFVE